MDANTSSKTPSSAPALPAPAEPAAGAGSSSQNHDALAAILPAERRAAMAQVLTPADFATLRHLAEKGTGPNTLRAIASDLNYLESWAQAALGHPLP